MITESFQEYKGFIIRLRAVTNHGFGYSIIKKTENAKSPNGIKNLYLRKVTYNFISPDELLQKAKSHIDEFSNQLNAKFERLRSE